MFDSNPPRRRELATATLTLTLVAIAYFATARIGYAFAIGAGAVTLWPPSGVTLALLLLTRRESWRPVLAGALAGSMASDLVSGYSPGLAVTAAVANVLESFVAARVVAARAGHPTSLSKMRALTALTVGAAVLSNAVTGLLGTVVLVYGFGMPVLTSWFFWWVGDGLGMLVVAPLILTWAEALRAPWRMPAKRIAEAGVLLACLAGVCYVTLASQTRWRFQPGPYFVFPLLLWAAVRFGPAGAATASIIAAAFAIGPASFGRGPFIAGAVAESISVFQVYVFLAIASLSSLIVAVAVEERRIAFQRLRQSETRYRDVVEAATDAIVRFDERGTIRFANAAASAMFGHPVDALTGRDLDTIVPARGAGGDTWQRQPAPGTVVPGRHRAGHEIPLEVSIGESSLDGRREFTGILRDVSEKRAAAEALQALEDRYRQAQKMEAVGRLAGGIAHDFNNVLTVIQGNCDLLMDGIDADSEQGQDLAHIRAAAERAAALTRQLLAFSRRQVLAPKKIRLEQSAAALEPMLRRLIGIDVTVEVASSSTGQVLADPGQMEQVILNLALNARDAMPGGGRLRIEIDDVELGEAHAALLDLEPGPHVRLQVIDTGVGMTAETLALVFEPFFTTKPEGQGTGLGLATVHGIVKQSRGGIEARSTVGAGTTFAVYLPTMHGAQRA